MDDFYAARSGTIPPLPWSNFAPPLSVRAEIARLKRSEPHFKVVCVDGEGKPVSSLQYEYLTFQPLTDSEITQLVDRARARFPMKTDFTAPKAQKTTQVVSFAWEALAGLHMPPDEKQITEYHKSYQDWERDLRTTLKGIHEGLGREVSTLEIAFVATNAGTRPAKDVLIEIETAGNLLLRRPQRRDEDAEPDEEGVLPKPPLPPKRARSIVDITRQLGAIGHGYSNVSPLRYADLSHTRRPRDPEGFFYKGGNPYIAETSIRLECALWRHGIKPEQFEATIDLDNVTDTRGAVTFRVHAENLTDFASVTVPTSVKVARYSTFDHSMALIDQLSAEQEDG